MSGNSGTISIMNKTTYRLNIFAAVLFGLSMGLILGIPIPSHTGYVTPLSNGMGVVLVRQQSPTIMTIAFDQVVSYASSASIPNNADQYATTLNSYGTALEILNKKTYPGVMIMRIKGTEAPSSYSIRIGDIVKLNETQVKEIARDPLARQRVLEKLFLDTELLHKDGTSGMVSLPKEYFNNLVLQDISTIYLPKEYDINKNVLKAKGNSDGLPLAIYFLDSMTKGELMPEYKVAATGALASGSISDKESHPVIAIGSLDVKHAAVEREKYKVFFIPRANQEDIKVKGKSKVIIVENVESAIKELCKMTNHQDEVCKRANIKKIRPDSISSGYYNPAGNY
jgi:PDZ domain-containing secreted protein